jgi:hypothetical protein
MGEKATGRVIAPFIVMNHGGESHESWWISVVNGEPMVDGVAGWVTT